MVVLGSSFRVALVVVDVEPPDSLHAYEFDLDYAGTVLTGLAAFDAGFLQAPVFALEFSLDPTRISLATTSIGELGSLGSGVVAEFDFLASAVGSSPLDLHAVILSAPDGIEIQGVTLQDGLIHVVAEPSRLALLAAALAGLAGRWRRSARG